MRKSSSLPDMPQIAISSKYENQMWLPREHASKQDIEREQQGIIQKELLYQLALKNINESDLSSISKKHREVFKKIMESNDLEQNTYCAQQSLIQKALLYQLAVEKHKTDDREEASTHEQGLPDTSSR